MDLNKKFCQIENMLFSSSPYYDMKDIKSVKNYFKKHLAEEYHPLLLEHIKIVLSNEDVSQLSNNIYRLLYVTELFSYFKNEDDRAFGSYHIENAYNQKTGIGSFDYCYLPYETVKCFYEYNQKIIKQIDYVLGITPSPVNECVKISPRAYKLHQNRYCKSSEHSDLYNIICAIDRYYLETKSSIISADASEQFREMKDRELFDWKMLCRNKREKEIYANRLNNQLEDLLSDINVLNGKEILKKYIYAKEMITWMKSHDLYVWPSITNVVNKIRPYKSKGERMVAAWLNNNNIHFVYEPTFPGLKYKSLLHPDFYIPDKNIIIEVDGEQHYHPVDIFGGEDAFADRQIRDRIKDDYAAQNNILLVRLVDKDLKNLDDILKNL